MSFSYTSLVIRPSCWGQGSPLCPCLRPRPPVIVAAQVLKEQKPLSGSGEDHARIGCALFYTDDRQPASDHQSLQNSMTHARSGLSDLLLVRAHLLFLSSQTQPDPVAWMVAPTARIFEQMHHCDIGVSPASKNPFFWNAPEMVLVKKNLGWWRVIVCRC